MQRKKLLNLEATVTNEGRNPANEAHIAIKISKVIDNFEVHPWRKIYDISIGELKQIPEVDIMPDEAGLSYIATLLPEDNCAITKTLHNQQGYPLELDRQYYVQVKVTGHFSTVK
jgi:hypothetical protein